MLAARAGCMGVFIGFESTTMEGLAEVGKKFNYLKGRDFKASVRRIQRHHILVAGSFIIGLDTDTLGIGKRIAAAAERYCDPAGGKNFLFFFVIIQSKFHALNFRLKLLDF